MLRQRPCSTSLCIIGLVTLAAACGGPLETETTPTTTTTTTGTQPDPPSCGDGVVDEGEECDDGNNAPGDTCSPECTKTLCGNGAVDDGEECDDGNTDPTDDCTTECKVAACGDGFLHASVEECDAAGDGCDATCTRLPVLDVTGYCALLFDHQVKCWGSGSVGALGLGDQEDRGDEPGEMGAALPRVALGTGESVIALSSGYAHNCALLEGGKVKCWGANGPGQLGIESPYARGDDPDEMGDALPLVNLGTGKKAIAIASGHAFNCAILDDQSVKCWGHNVIGQLGIGDVINRGDSPGEMGDGLPAVNLGTGKYAVQIATAYEHTCALLNDGAVKCWGGNLEGELGLGDIKIRGDEPSDMGDALPAVNLGTGLKVIQIAAGDHTSCALFDDGRMKCWGPSDCSQVGGPATLEKFGDEPEDMGDNLPFNDLGEHKATFIAVGWGGVCALLEDGNVTCWGCAPYGGLGMAGPKDDLGTDVVDLGTGRTAKSIFIDYPRTCAVLDNGTIKCWGYNVVGQLGLGDTMHRGSTVGDMGDNLPIVPIYDDRW